MLQSTNAVNGENIANNKQLVAKKLTPIWNGSICNSDDGYLRLKESIQSRKQLRKRIFFAKICMHSILFEAPIAFLRTNNIEHVEIRCFFVSFLKQRSAPSNYILVLFFLQSL